MSCGKSFAPGQWWGFCGETDMGQTMPVLCTECGGTYALKKAGRCSGQCCEAFPLPSITHLREHPKEVQNGQQILDMILPVHRKNDRGHELFTCRHFNHWSGDCGIYATRPKMCSDYPYGHPCTWDDCTYTGCGTPRQPKGKAE